MYNRLKEVKQLHEQEKKTDFFGQTLHPRDIDWLIEQAEKAEKQQMEIDHLKETVRIYKASDELVREQSKKVKHLFPLETTAGYGQLCDKVIEQQKEIDRMGKMPFIEVNNELREKIERYEKALKEIERWDKMLYSSRELGNFAKKALALPTIPLKD